MSLTQGQILNNRYRIVKLLGQGGFGAVYKAWDLNFEVVCAIKENFETSPEAQRQFLREARLLHVLRHPNLPLVKDHFVIPGQGQYLVMDFVEGQDLEELRCAAGGRLPEAQVLPWITQVCDALDYMHRQTPPVIHRDLKPANIKITPAGRAVLVDFGIAKTYDPALKTTLGARAVTPGYSPIEQYGTGVTDARTDLYSLGATLYTLLTGQEPPEAPQRVLRDPLLPPRQLNPAISPALEATLLHALLVDPEQRFQSAAEFKAALSSALGGSPEERGKGSGVRYVSNQPPVVTQPPSPLRIARGGAGGDVSPATLGMPLPPSARPFSWKGVRIGASLLAGLALLAIVAGMISCGISGSHLTQTPQDRVTQTVQIVAAAASFTSTPSPLPLPLTPTEDVFISPLDGMVLRYIPAGTFQMGSQGGDSDERPVHTVTLAAFWMDQTEVTNAMYATFLNVMGNQTESGVTWLDAADSDVDIHQQGGQWVADTGRESNPVREVSWYGAAAYCTWAGRELPTEAQWEFAARGGLAGTDYPWGHEAPSCTLGAQNGAQSGQCLPDDTVPVASFAPNGYGLFDMAGNVWERVADWYGAAYYSSSPVENPAGPASGSDRTLRGGSWHLENPLRISNRVRYNPGDTDSNIGFRCANSP